MADEPKNAEIADGSTKLERQLAQTAYRKLSQGQELTGPERAALKRYDKEREERLRWQYYHAIPQKHWREMSGRQTKVLNEQSANYGIPFGGATISLPAVVRALHDFLARNARRLRDDDPLLSTDGNSPALERYREERAQLARLDRLERERLLVPRDEVREGLGQIAQLIRMVGEALQRQYGQAAVELLYEALDEAEQVIEERFGEVPVDGEIDEEVIMKIPSEEEAADADE